MFLPKFQATCFQQRANSRVQVVCLLIGFLLTLVGNVSARTPKYTYFELKVEHPHYFSPEEDFFIDIMALNVSSQTFINGDVTVSFKGEVICEVIAHNATSLRQLPKGSKIFSVEKRQSVLSEDMIVQALKDNWQPQQVVSFRLKLTDSTPPLRMLVRVAGKLKGGKELIFEPTVGVKDQQGIYAESFLMKSYDLNSDGEVYEYITTPKGIRPQLLFKLSPQTTNQNPRLLGAFDFDNDGTEEVFLEWNKGEYGEIHHYQIYDKKVTEEYALLGEFELDDTPHGGVQFITEPDPKQPRKVIFVIQGGSYWGTYYLLRRDGKSADKLRAAANIELIDLNHDGIYELVFGEWHNMDERLNHDHLRVMYMEVFQWDNSSFSYQRRWPPEGWRDYDASVSDGKGYQIGAILYDVDDNGDKEIVALTDTEEEGGKGRKLAIYKLSNEALALISQLDVTSPYTTVDILGIRRLGDRKQFVLLLEQPRSYEERQKGVRGMQIVEGYDFKDGHLVLAWRNERIRITSGDKWSIIPVVDTDGDGQEEMRFVDEETGKSIILKGEKEFLQE